jgi:periplasmic copper chaperone A
MRHKILCLLIVFGLLLMPVLVQGQESECQFVSLFDAWAGATGAGMPNGAVYGYLVNLGTEADTLISARTDVAEVVEFHETIIGENDVMQMQPLADGLALEADSYLQLQPGGYHIMLFNLVQPLEAGSIFDLTLMFEQAGEVTVTIPVRERDAEAHGMGMTMHAEATPEMMMPVPLEIDDACATLQILGAWARPANAAMPNSAAYALLLNLTNTDIQLVSASSPVAQAVELHEMIIGDDDVMQMRPLEDGILVPAGGLVHLKPGGFHVMLIGLNQDLAVDSTINLTFGFADETVLELEVPVQAPPEAPMPMHE